MPAGAVVFGWQRQGAPPPEWRWRHNVAFAVTGACALAACGSTLLLVRRHLRAEGRHEIRVAVIRILLIVPLFSVVAWVSLVERLRAFNTVLDFLKKGYECIAICAFMQLLVAHLGGVERLTSELSLDSCRHLIPVKWFVPEWSWTPQRRFVRRTVGAVLLYVPVTLSVAVMALVSSLVYFPLFKILHWPFISVVNVLLFIAMYGLVLFYHANQARLAPLNPIKKILSIKILLFFTFWQGVVVSILHRLHYLDGFAHHSRSHWDPEQIANGVTNSLLCVEMLLMSIFHHWVYPPGEAPLVAEPAPADDELSGYSRDPAPGPAAGATGAWARLREALRVWDIVDFYRSLRAAARTPSTDDLLRSSSIPGRARSYTRFLLFRFFQGSRCAALEQASELADTPEAGGAAAEGPAPPDDERPAEAGRRAVLEQASDRAEAPESPGVAADGPAPPDDEQPAEAGRRAALGQAQGVAAEGPAPPDDEQPAAAGAPRDAVPPESPRP